MNSKNRNHTCLYRARARPNEPKAVTVKAKQANQYDEKEMGGC